MEIRYIVSMSGVKDYPAFEKDNKGEWVYYDVDKLEAVNLVSAEYAVAKDEKEYKAALAEVETLKAKKEADKKLAADLLELDELKGKQKALQDELNDVTARIEAVEAATAKKAKAK